jgi:hypothetical protein
VNTGIDMRNRRAEQPECPTDQQIKGEKTLLFGGVCFILTSMLHIAHG